jgi:hypothetical protein
MKANETSSGKYLTQWVGRGALSWEHIKVIKGCNTGNADRKPNRILDARSIHPGGEAGSWQYLVEWTHTTGIVAYQSWENYQAIASSSAYASYMHARCKYKTGTKRELNSQEPTALYCICRQPYEPQDKMIACDACCEWYHLKCLRFRLCTQHNNDCFTGYGRVEYDDGRHFVGQLHNGIEHLGYIGTTQNGAFVVFQRQPAASGPLRQCSGSGAGGFESANNKDTTTKFKQIIAGKNHANSHQQNLKAAGAALNYKQTLCI